MGAGQGEGGALVIGVEQLIAHACGDYVLQSDWMALTKTKRSVACLAHVGCYTLPFLFLTRNPWALVFILVTHFIIDRWRLARYVCWAKNWLSPERPPPWAECTGTGYPPERPLWLATWLLIITDNLMHICCNALARHYGR